MKLLPSLAIALVFSSAAVQAQNGYVSVLHGIPGLPKAVEVFADGGKLFSFDYGDFKGPLSLPPKTYRLEVKLDGSTVLSADAKVEADTNYTVVAHLKETSGIQLSVFVNDTSKIDRGESRVHVRHLADAPAVDVIARRFWRSTKLFENVSNGQGGVVDVRSGRYAVSLNAAGSRTTAFGPVRLDLASGKNYAVHAIGKLGESSFQLFVQSVENPKMAPKLVGMVRGKACGGAISLSTMMPEFDKEFDVKLTGATKNGSGLLHTGLSDSRFLGFNLPLGLWWAGARGCTLYQNTMRIQPIQIDANGEASVTTKIPMGYAHWFKEIHYQYSFRSNTNRLGLLLTDYASVERQ